MKTTNLLRKATMLCAALLLVATHAACSNTKTKQTTETITNAKILFINGSPNKDGNTAELAKILLEGKTYESLYLTDYRINFYGQEAEGGLQRKVLDHIFENGEVAPTIVVSPSYNYGQPTANYADADPYCKALPQELTNDLIPVVESRYRTFLASPDRAGIEASRDHRAIGGFSMGGVTTWYALAETLGCFRYFLPMSGDCWSLGRFAGMNRPQETARYLAEVVHQSPYGDAFYIWAASGTNDSVYREILVQIEAMADITDVFGLSKMTFHEKDGARHEFLPTAEYVYNALPFFFPPGHTVQDAPYTTYIRERHLIPYPHLTFSYLPRYLRIG